MIEHKHYTLTREQLHHMILKARLDINKNFKRVTEKYPEKNYSIVPTLDLDTLYEMIVYPDEKEAITEPERKYISFEISEFLEEMPF